MPQPMKLPPGATLVQDAPMKLPPGATLVSDAPAPPAQSRGPLDSLADWGNKTFANSASRFSAQHPATSAQDIAEEFGRPGENMVKSGIRTLTGLPSALVDAGSSVIHPIDAFKKSAGNFTQEDQGQAKYGTFGQAARSITPGELEQNVTDVGGSLLAADGLGRMVGGAAKIPSAIKMLARGDVDAPMIGSTTTPRQRFDSAKNLGVRLDAADATNSPFFNVVKKVNENSLAGSPSYEALKNSNTTALRGATDEFLNGMYAGDRQSGGLAIQKALKENQAGLHADATEGFKSLPQDYPLAASPDLGRFAQRLGDEQKSYYSQFPSLQPTKALNVVGDVGGLAAKPPMPAKLGAFGMLQDAAGITPPPTAMGTPAPANFATIQRLRSDLLDFNRNNPDIVKNQSGGWLQQLAGKADATMTDGANGLPPVQQKAFRDANAKWEDMKGTYDDPSSPFYHAVRTDNPSSLYSGVGPKTPENVIDLQGRLGGAIAPLRRGTVESALKPTNEGLPNFNTFGTQINRIPADYRSELFTTPQNQTLRDVASTSNVMGKDFNPSGSGKHTQKYLEAAAIAGGVLNPLAAVAPLAQYPVAKMMTNPRAVEWLMAPKAPSNPFLAPGATAATLAADPRRKN